MVDDAHNELTEVNVLMVVQIGHHVISDYKMSLKFYTGLLNR